MYLLRVRRPIEIQVFSCERWRIYKEAKPLSDVTLVNVTGLTPASLCSANTLSCNQ